MPKESTIQHYTSSTTGNTPAAIDIASGELAINTADEKVFYKNHNGAVLSLSQTKDLSGAFASSSRVVSSFNGASGAVSFAVPLASATVTGVASFGNEFTVSAVGAVGLTSNYVKSVNGLTGTVVGIATTGSNTFTGLQTMNAGLTANNLYVSQGATFASPIQGTAASFTGLVSSTIGFSGSAANLVGNASGLTAGTASKVQIAEAASASYYLALAGGVGNTGIFVDTTAPRWLYNTSTGALTTTAGSVSADSLVATTGMFSNNWEGFDGNTPMKIRGPYFDGTFQTITIGDVNGDANGTTIIIDDGAGVIEFGAFDIAAYGNLNLKGSTPLAFYNATNSNYVAFKGPTGITVNTTWTLPSADGSSNQVLTTNGSGTLSWTTPSGGGGGSSVTSFNGATGAVQVTGSGAILQTVSGTTTTLGARLATTSVTGVASFDTRHFALGASGHVSLTGPYQVTGQTIVAGNHISTTTSGNTVTLNVTGSGPLTAIQYKSETGLSGHSNFAYDSSTAVFTVGNIDGGARTITLSPGADARIAANGNSNLLLQSGNGGTLSVIVGDTDGNGNGTKIQIDDDASDIYAVSTTMSFIAGGAVAINSSGFTVSGSGGMNCSAGGATFNGDVNIEGNSNLGNAATDTTTIYGAKIINEGVYANGSLRTANISFANGQVQTLTGVGTGATGTTAIYFTNPPSTGAASVTMIITNGGLMTGTGMTAWGGNIKWAGGIKPVLTDSGVDVVSFVTPNAGTTIYGFVGGLGFS